MSQAEASLRQAIESPLLNEEDTSFIFIDLAQLIERLENVRSAFPSHWRHTAAIKANPLMYCLSEIAKQGFGLEAASFGEALMAHKVNADFIVWDSPVKTESEIEQFRHIKAEKVLNANSLEELIDNDYSNIEHVGLRVNPEMKLSAHTSMSVGSALSKFGEPISNRAAIISHFQSSPRKLGLHVHASSQNLKTDEGIEAILKVVQLAEEIGFEQIDYIDIGGGYPVAYSGEIVAPIADYAEKLLSACPQLNDPRLLIITEFGRYYHAHAGTVFSRVHSVKSLEQTQVIIHHLGADMFVRESYQPGVWPHKLGVFDSKGSERKTNILSSDIAGPLCFGGDYIEKGAQMPAAQSGDWLSIEDTGANSFALWSMHCSRQFPKVICQVNGELKIIRERQKLDELLSFWA